MTYSWGLCTKEYGRLYVGAGTLWFSGTEEVALCARLQGNICDYNEDCKIKRVGYMGGGYLVAKFADYI